MCFTNSTKCVKMYNVSFKLYTNIIIIRKDEYTMNTESNATKTYMANSQAAAAGLATLKQFKEETKDPMTHTTKLLMKILDDNKDTEYGKRYGFADIHSIEDYQKKVPVIVYDDISVELERMLNGEKNILTAYNYDHMNETSGTVGVPKVVPMTNEQSETFARHTNLLIFGALEEHFGENDNWKKGRAFCTVSGTYRRMESGITVGEAASKMADYMKGGADALDTMLRTTFTSPVEAVSPKPGTDNKYIHARFALMDRDVRGLITGFYAVAVLFLRYIANNYKLLIDDIDKGTISDEIDMPDDVRESLLAKIEPMPERAAELREIFKDGSEIQFVPKIWPEFCYIIGVGGDGFSVYDKTLRDEFMGNDIVNVYSGITASEGVWSVPFRVNDLDSVIAPLGAFVEFLPVEAGSDFSKCVTMDKVEIGKVYELIITNLSGFYRYRMSDAVQITGMYNNTPKVQFMYRVNRTINLAEEKTTEKALQVTVENVAEELGFDLSDFSVYPDTSVTPNRYVFLIEPRRETTGITREMLEESVFRHLCKANPVYEDCYKDDWLQKPEAYFLQPETTLLYRDMMVMRGASQSQLKPVRIIMNERQRKFFFGLRDMDRQ